jgi:membrane protein DedA with SNARE-associated domain
MSIHSLIANYGYLAVFTLVAAESFGIPLPGETALITAAIYAGVTHRLSPEVIFVIGAVAAILGDTCGYWIGDRGGYPLVRRFGHYVRLDDSKLKIARYLFTRHGGKVVFFGRFVSVLRTYAAFLAGMNKMHYRRFLVFNATGGIVWCAVFTFGAYWFGNRISQIAGPAGIALIGASVAIVIASLLVGRRQIGVLSERAEAAFPAPLDSNGLVADAQ